MLRPWFGAITLALAFVTIAFESLVLVLFFTFIGLEIVGLLVAATMLTNGITGMLTGKVDLSYQVRQGIFLFDYILSILLAMASFCMVCGTFTALTVFIYIAMLVGTPGIYEIMLFFGIPFTPLLSLIVIKGAMLLVYVVVFVLSVSSAVLNRRNQPQ